MTKKIGFFLLIGIFLVSISFILGLPQKASANIADSVGYSPEFEKRVYVGPDEVIDDNFVRMGEIVDVNGTVNGDVIVAGGTVNINSTVQGDVIAGGGTVRVKGDVKGNVRVGGGTVEIDADIGKNATIFGGTVTISEDTTIGWSLAFGSGTADIGGTVGGHIDGGSSQTNISATVGGNVNLTSDQEALTIISSPAVIKGNLTYTGDTAPTVQKGAEIKGNIIQKSAFLTSFEKRDFLNFLGISTWFFRLFKLFGLLVVGLVVITLMKKESFEIAEFIKKEPAKSIGWGIIYLIVTPIATFILTLTIIGAPLALIITALYLIAVYASKVFVGIFLGKEILAYFQKDKKDKPVSSMGAMVLGLIIFVLLTYIPYLGWFIGLVGIVFGLGAIVEVKKKYLKERN